ncbi:hypothetical protein [Thermosyntropha sp.]|uniref:putative amidoligase domain-containing protein n=1 Tax=Thermosyntropha sp. TaxID=2740820 RepID=UPI0025E1AC76|nr:hypothetical protein [Thermosyntropha sp.]MBO8158417.1 hypothetical protein [Thermosyntropha sp.]
MNLVFFYSKNETGEALKKIIGEELEDVNSRDIEIEKTDYLQINIYDQNSTCKLIINSPEAIVNTQKEKMSKILKLNNIPFSYENIDKANRIYEIVVCDFNIISIKAKNTSKTKKNVEFIREGNNPKIAEMARKTLYILGLDIGKVYIILNARRQYKVTSVDPSPILRQKELNAVKAYIKKIYNIDDYVQKREVKIGADPEFLLINSKNQKIVAASNFFPREGVVGCDNIRMPNRQQRPIAEIRPKPSFSPLELTHNIKEALIAANKLAPHKNIKWLAGSQPANEYSTGGHIHFSNTELNFKLLRALDNYLGIIGFLLENPVPAAKRRKKYGFIGDVRKKEHGGFEYRTLGSWLISPQITLAILCLAKIVASKYPYLSMNYFCSIEAQKAFYNGEQERLKIYFKYLWNDIKNTDIYFLYCEHLQIIPEMIEKNTNWDEKIDIRKAWSISIKKTVKTSKSNLNINRAKGNTSANRQITRISQISINSRNSNSQTTRRRNIPRRVNNTLPVRINPSGRITRH